MKLNRNQCIIPCFSLSYTASTHCLHVNIHTAYHILLKEKINFNKPKRGKKWRTENGFKFWPIEEKTTTNRCVHTTSLTITSKPPKRKLLKCFSLFSVRLVNLGLICLFALCLAITSKVIQDRFNHEVRQTTDPRQLAFLSASYIQPYGRPMTS